jgi:hypothetical protein
MFIPFFFDRLKDLLVFQFGVSMLDYMTDFLSVILDMIFSKVYNCKTSRILEVRSLDQTKDLFPMTRLK